MVLALHLELEMPIVMLYGADLDHTPEQVCYENENGNKQESVVGSVIQATETKEFEDGCWCLCGGCTYLRINSKSPWGCGLVLRAVKLS